MSEQKRSLEKAISLVGLSTGALMLSACGAHTPAKTTEAKCKPFELYAQNRFPAANGGYGAAVRSQPSINAEKIGSYAGNEKIRALGYVVTKAKAYPNNSPEIDGDHWVVINDPSRGGRGFITDSGVRTAQTTEDPDGMSPDLGPTVDFDTLPAACNLTKQ